MQAVQIPLGSELRVGGPLLMISVCLAVLACPIVWPWRLFLALLGLLLGVWQWHRFLRRRPVAVAPGLDRGINCQLADGSTLTVSQLRIGVLRPWLVSARLEGQAGERVDLFVPGRALPETAHRQLRRWLIWFRASESPAGGHDSQAGGRRGT
jgi:hypothetical protein